MDGAAGCELSLAPHHAYALLCSALALHVLGACLARVRSRWTGACAWLAAAALDALGGALPAQLAALVDVPRMLWLPSARAQPGEPLLRACAALAAVCAFALALLAIPSPIDATGDAPGYLCVARASKYSLGAWAALVAAALCALAPLRLHGEALALRDAAEGARHACALALWRALYGLALALVTARTSGARPVLTGAAALVALAALTLGLGPGAAVSAARRAQGLRVRGACHLPGASTRAWAGPAALSALATAHVLAAADGTLTLDIVTCAALVAATLAALAGALGYRAHAPELAAHGWADSWSVRW